MTDELLEKPALNRPLVGGIIVGVIVILLGGYLWYTHSSAPPKPAITSVPPPVVAPAPAVQHPLPAPDAAKGPLPELNDSDKAIATAIGEATSPAAATSYLVPENIIRHIVVTVDNLPRQKVAADKRPIVAAPGAFLARGDELHATLDPQNFRRYSPMVEALRRVDMQRLAAVYLRFYPLFQKAYQDQGYPTEYFNDRLVKVIDELLATPQITGPIDLTRPNVLYVFADQSLESRPAGQKVLIRMGPDNAAVVKAKLGEFRSAITAAAPRH